MQFSAALLLADVGGVGDGGDMGEGGGEGEELSDPRTNFEKSMKAKMDKLETKIEDGQKKIEEMLTRIMAAAEGGSKGADGADD